MRVVLVAGVLAALLLAAGLLLYQGGGDWEPEFFAADWHSGMKQGESGGGKRRLEDAAEAPAELPACA